jgi:hypothetical protein
MKKHLLRIFIAGSLFTAGNLNAQTRAMSTPIDMSGYSPIRFNMETTTESQREAMNKAHHDFLLKRDSDYDKKRNDYEKMIQQYILRNQSARTTAGTIVIPVVIHIVWNNANPAGNISDAQAISQITVLNEDYGRTNADTTQTPAVWKSRAVNTHIQFCLAQRTPTGNPSNGIERKQNNAVTSWTTDDKVKFASSGGLDIWDPTKYLNIWVCDLGAGLLGYGEFPTGSTSPTYGVVILNSGFGNQGTVTSPYQLGRTTTHEFSHCFNLFHIWGDDGTACTGTDYCGDTPNQAGSTNNCPAFPHIDACSSTTGTNAGDPVNGIMFMNYMDYSFDNCMNMFTANQSTRMNAVLQAPPYNALATSNGCTPVNLSADDAGVALITTPSSTLCNTSFTPVVVLKDYGNNALTSCTIKYSVDGAAPIAFSWTGNLASQLSTNVTLTSASSTIGNHTFTAWTSLPNGNADSQTSNDSLKLTFSIVGTGLALPYAQGFEGSTFVPTGWTLNNPDANTTWARTTAAAKTGAASAYLDNFNYGTGTGQFDEMILQGLDLTTVSAPVITWQVAYTYYNQTNPPPAAIFGDTLEILVSTDCGATWSSAYKKGGVQLATATPPANAPNNFTPTSSQWRFESTALSAFKTSKNATIKFRNISNNGDDMYIDDINVANYTGINELQLNAALKVFPNPTSGDLSVQFDLPVTGNFQLRVYNLLGQTINSVTEQNSLGGLYSIDLSKSANGIYFVEVITNSGSVTRKVVLDRK